MVLTYSFCKQSIRTHRDNNYIQLWISLNSPSAVCPTQPQKRSFDAMTSSLAEQRHRIATETPQHPPYHCWNDVGRSTCSRFFLWLGVQMYANVETFSFVWFFHCLESLTIRWSHRSSSPVSGRVCVFTGHSVDEHSFNHLIINSIKNQESVPRRAEKNTLRIFIWYTLCG